MVWHTPLKHLPAVRARVEALGYRIEPLGAPYRDRAIFHRAGRAIAAAIAAQGLGLARAAARISNHQELNRLIPATTSIAPASDALWPGLAQEQRAQRDRERTSATCIASAAPSAVGYPRTMPVAWKNRMVATTPALSATRTRTDLRHRRRPTCVHATPPAPATPAGWPSHRQHALGRVEVGAGGAQVQEQAAITERIGERARHHATSANHAWASSTPRVPGPASAARRPTPPPRPRRPRAGCAPAHAGTATARTASPPPPWSEAAGPPARPACLAAATLSTGCRTTKPTLPTPATPGAPRASPAAPARCRLPRHQHPAAAAAYR